ncbi:hypothetical protein M0811_02544 [Anaeramoeba ignava]|uniref:Uncharacterized protein n=1 Tax=Anaeramoeba ignava TaxID=1746090 RepID=A0A9Q0L934_ANAIG|nr:hypothetical protein M0811_02544 [Anaeramoeba ignava]
MEKKINNSSYKNAEEFFKEFNEILSIKTNDKNQVIILKKMFLEQMNLIKESIESENEMNKLMIKIKLTNSPDSIQKQIQQSILSLYELSAYLFSKSIDFFDPNFTFQEKRQKVPIQQNNLLNHPPISFINSFVPNEFPKPQSNCTNSNLKISFNKNSKKEQNSQKINQEVVFSQIEKIPNQILKDILQNQIPQKIPNENETQNETYSKIDLKDLDEKTIDQLHQFLLQKN